MEDANIIVRKPNKDICGICHQCGIGNRKTGKRCSNNDLDSDDDDGNGNDEIPTKSKRLFHETQQIGRDLKALEAAKVIKQHIKYSTSMRALWQKVIKDAKTSTSDNDVA
jgi:hypothetical protein